MNETIEQSRVRLAEEGKEPWLLLGPYLSERAWATVREDYSPDGEAWSYFPHEHARFRTYRWSEDGIGGVSDDKQHLCLAHAFWNGRDPILKERMFGLTGSEGNHGEDVKEAFFYLDSTPTHSYMRMNYKYPHAEFPYAPLIEENRKRSRTEPEFELWDTGIFADDRYFDIDIEYAKASPEDLLCRITVRNMGPDPAPIHVLPTLWFRNTWSWGRDDTRSLGSNAKMDLGRLLRAARMRLPEPMSCMRTSRRTGCFPKTRRISNTSTAARTHRLLRKTPSTDASSMATALR